MWRTPKQNHATGPCLCVLLETLAQCDFKDKVHLEAFVNTDYNTLHNILIYVTSAIAMCSQ